MHKRRRAVQALYSNGRWSLLKMPIVSDPIQHIEAACWQLLKRYGVVFRDLITREKNSPAWRDLLIGFRRLEDQGEIRGGYFVAGFLGEQFALPSAVDSLRAIKNKILTQEKITLSAVDPLNMVGFITPGNRIPALANSTVTLLDGVVID
jgi:ATP-dependent Lhr-like helicase